MKKLSLISTAFLGSALVACGGGSGSPSKPDLCSELGATNCNQVVVPSSSSSNSSSSSSVAPPLNSILPMTEKFAVDNALQLFAPAYKSLLEPDSEDLNPSFYYSTSGLDAGRIVARNGQMTIGNARMTLGQRLQTTGTHINPAALPSDYKVNTTTDGTAANSPTTTTWGELDLSQPWKISFCVNEFEALSGSASNQQFMVYVDNNQSNSSFSIHGTKSLVKQLNVTNFVAGKRVEFNFPGDVFVDGKSIDSVLENPATSTSFIQLRVPSAGVVTMSELWIGYQSDKTTEPTASTCSVAPRVPGWNVAPPAADPTTLPTVVAGDSQLEVSWTELARATAYQVAHNTANTADGATLSADITGTNYSIKDLQNNQPYYLFYRGKNSAGVYTAWSPSVSATPVPSLAPPVAPQAPTLTAGDAQIDVTWAAIDGASTYQVAFSEVNDPATATAFGDATSATSITITGLTNGTAYFVFVKAQNSAGESVYSAAAEATPVAPVVTAWTAEAVNLVGTSPTDPSGTTSVSTETAVTLTATGGNLSSSAHNIFFVHQEIAKSDFVFTARIASVTGADTGVGNSYRFGLMVISDINSVTTYADLAGWASIGFYVSAPQTLVGSRANMKLDNTRTRNDIATAPNVLVLGDWVRIEVYDDGLAKRVRRLISKDNGVTFTQINSSTDFKATSATDNWFVGVYAAPGANNLTIEFDNISIADYVPPAL